MQEPRPIEDLLDQILAGLPTGLAVVAHRDGQRLVASTGGIFVLDARPDQARRAAERAAAAAQVTRELLAQHLSWVPFVDWLVIADPDSPADAHDVVPLDLVAATVLEGHAVSAQAVEGIRGLLRDGALAPVWQDGLTLAPTPRVG